MEIDADAPVVARREIVVRAPTEIVRGQGGAVGSRRVRKSVRTSIESQ